MICPKCGFEQPDGSAECARCGIVFARYRQGPAEAPPPAPAGPLDAGPIEPGPPPFAPAPAATLYGGPLAPEGPALPPPPQLYGDAPLPPPPSYSPGLAAGRPFEMGAILAETFRTYFANFLPFYVLSMIAFSPVLLWTLLSLRQTLTPQAALQHVAGVGLLGILCGPMTTAAVTFGVFQQMRGRNTSIGECLQVGLRNLLPVLGVAIVQGLVVTVGAIFCVVPGLIFWAMYGVAVPAAVEEHPGVIGAMDRSSKLTESYRWPVFGVLLVLVLLNIGATLVATFLSGLLFAGSLGLSQLLQQGLNLIVAGLTATASAVLYYRLRSVKESIDVDRIASVFD